MMIFWEPAGKEAIYMSYYECAVMSLAEAVVEAVEAMACSRWTNVQANSRKMCAFQANLNIEH
jgi:hypothetical protein